MPTYLEGLPGEPGTFVVRFGRRHACAKDWTLIVDTGGGYLTSPDPFGRTSRVVEVLDLERSWGQGKRAKVDLATYAYLIAELEAVPRIKRALDNGEFVIEGVMPPSALLARARRRVQARREEDERASASAAAEEEGPCGSF